MKSKEEIEQLSLDKYPVEMVEIFSKRGFVDKNEERRKIFIESYQQALDENCDIYSIIKSFEISLENEYKLITEAIGDVYTIANWNNEKEAFESIKSQFLVIDRQDLKKED